MLKHAPPRPRHDPAHDRRSPASLYPLAITGLAQALFPRPGERQPDRARRPGRRLGADRPELRQRPATSTAARRPPAPEPYDAAASSGSNLGPTSAALIERVAAEAAALTAENPAAPVPIDLVTTSGSGLDPHISPEAAAFQVPRVAAARGLPEDAGRAPSSTAHTEGRALGLLGEPRVNVLALNLALDAATAP